MTKQEMISLILKNLKAAVPDLANETIDTNMSYKDLGVSSLDLVEIVSDTMREIGVKLSPAELANVQSVDDLAALLAQAKGA